MNAKVSRGLMREEGTAVFAAKQRFEPGIVKIFILLKSNGPGKGGHEGRPSEGTYIRCFRYRG